MEKVIIQKKIGKKVRRFRLDHKITQTELARRCNCEKSNICRIEAGNTNPTAYTLHLIALNLGVTMSDLLEFV